MAETGERTSQNSQPCSPSEWSGRPPVAWRPVVVVAAVAAMVHLVVATRYGWHHDEFYYVICGRHPAFGYVDQPPLAPLLAGAAATLPGGVLPLRVLAIAAQVGCVVLMAPLVAELGGRRRAQIIAAAAVAACPVFVGASLLFGTSVLDQLAWVALLVLVSRALRLRTIDAWLLAGAVAGVGLENKDTIAALIVGIAVGLLLFHRDVLRTTAPWLAGGVALVVAAPNVIWDALHGWPPLQMARVLSGQQGGALGSLRQLPLLALVLAGPPLAALWVIGVRWLASRAGHEHRWMLVAAAFTMVTVTVSGGKDYYMAPILAGLFAAGAVRVGAAASARGRILWPAALTVSGLVALLIGLPVLPVTAENTLHLNTDVMQTYGWPQFVGQVNRAAATLPANTPIFTSNYGEAGALTILGPRASLHHPVYSAHNNYALWGPPPGRPDTTLCVGDFTIAYLHRSWSQVHEITPITLPDRLRTNEIIHHAAIYLCKQPRGSWRQLWPALRHLS